jgi:hypothetical protein
VPRKPKLSPITNPTPSFQVEWWDIERPKDYPLNARKWSAQAIAKVGNSIKTFGWRQPLVVDTEGVICIGHLRRAAAKAAGLTTCPIHVAADLSPEAIRGLRLADNRTHEEASWDLPMLAQEFGELKALDFDLEQTGFSLTQVQGFFRKLPELDGASAVGDLQYRIVVGCASEVHQAHLIERFTKEGLLCQALIS